MMSWAPLFRNEKRISGTKRNSVDTENDSENSAILRNKSGPSVNLWRPSSLVNLVNPNSRRHSAVFDSSPSPNNESAYNVVANINANTAIVPVERRIPSETLVPKTTPGWGTLVTIVLVQAKGLPDAPNDGSSHGVYCKISLGSQNLKSKTVANTQQPEWREQFKLHLLKDHLLRVSLWDKGKQKNFMGSSVLDLSLIEKERTHEIWQPLNDGFGSVHMSVTICNIRKRKEISNGEAEDKGLQDEHGLFNLNQDWKLVGQLHVRVKAAKGLSGKPNAYCSLEVDNERVRTHSVRGTSEPSWDNSFMFNVYDATSTLDLKVYDSSLMTSFHKESLGRVSIPLLRIQNGATKWYALKDKNKRSIAKGNCPRVLLEMSFFWNPLKASLRVFKPKEVKYLKKPPKFDIALVYKNTEFIRDTFVFLVEINENYKRLFEWENKDLSTIALTCWVLFWYNFKMWATPLLLLIPFFYFWICNRHHQEKSFMRGYGIVDTPDKENEKGKTERSLTGRLQDIPDMTLTITNGVDYMASLAEKMYNLTTFKVPFLSYLVMALLVLASIGLYLIPFNYIVLTLGIYKFSRKYLNPERILNNDLEDFLSRIPDTEVLNDWKELNVPEPPHINGLNIGNHPYTTKGPVYLNRSQIQT